MENNHRSHDVPCPVVDRSGGIFNRGFKTVAADEDAIRGQTHRFILLDRHLHGIARGRARGAVDNFEDFGERFADSFLVFPTGHSLRNHIEIGDIPRDVG